MTKLFFIEMTNPEPKFPLGRVVITKAAAEKLEPADVGLALVRHSRGDWGDLSERDRDENEFSLTHAYRLFSVYHGRDGTKFWIITEAGRTITTVLLPDDY
jgi:hypothetical protein